MDARCCAAVRYAVDGRSGGGGPPALARPAGVIFLLALIFAVPAMAQERQYSVQEERWRNAAWVDDVYIGATNALVSGLASAIVAVFRDDVPVGRAFVSGAAGGVAIYAGKRVAAARFDGAGLVGRQVASLGASVGRSAAAGRGPFDELAFPLGWASVYWDRADGGIEIRPDLNAIGWTLRLTFEPRTRFDWTRSVSAGAPVFLTRGATFGSGAAGRAYGNVIVADPAAEIPLDEILAHERVHVLQLDQHYALWGAPLERWATGLLGSRAAGLANRADLVTPTLLVGLALGTLWSGFGNPLETEAYYMHMR